MLNPQLKIPESKILKEKCFGKKNNGCVVYNICPFSFLVDYSPYIGPHKKHSCASSIRCMTKNWRRLKALSSLLISVKRLNFTVEEPKMTAKTLPLLESSRYGHS